MELPYSQYIWKRFYWVPFPGWIVYFTMAYYMGCNYPALIAFLIRHRSLLLVSPIVTGGILFYLFHSGVLSVHSSKRVDIIFHTIAVFLFLFYFANQSTFIPKLIMMINKYSYGIYLIHPFYMGVFIMVINFAPFNFGVLSILILFVGSMVGSIVTIYYVNTFTWGKYILGKVDVSPLSTTNLRAKLRVRLSSILFKF